MLNKKFNYNFNVCPICEQGILSREETREEKKKFYEKHKHLRSMSEFDMYPKIVVKDCDCGARSDSAIGFSVSFKKAKELLEMMLT